MTIRFGTDGIRGRVGDTITAEVAYAVGRAAAEVLVTGGRLLVGRDTRQSGPELARAVHAGALDGGAGEVVHLGVVPTPVLAAITVAEGLPGCMITASHNPYHDNGLKLFNRSGLKLSPEEERAVEAGCNSQLDVGVRTLSGSAVDDVTVEPEPEAASWVDAYVGEVVARADDVSGLRVGLDFAHGAGSFLGPQLFEQLKPVAAHHIGAEPDGININDGVGSTAPEALMDAVVTGGLDVGFAFDGDGDRVLAVAEDGRLVDGDEIMAILAIDMADRGRLTDRSLVVTNWSNLGLLKAMAANQISVTQTEVGDKYILEELNRSGSSLGGEQSGHIILRDRATTGDGILVAVEVLGVMARTGRSLRQLASDAMQRVPQVSRAVRVSAPPRDVVSGLQGELAAQRDRLGDDGRVVLRPSGTEPVVRVMAEAPTEAEAADVVEELSGLVAAFDRRVD